MTLPKQVKKVLDEYINLLDKYFPNTLEEIYLHGSIAVNAYVDNSSDIDFITVMNRRLFEEDTKALASIHSTLAQKYNKPDLDGVYIIWDDLGKINFRSNNGKYHFYNDGELQFGNYFNFNPVTWWILKNNGIKVTKRNPKNEEFKVTALDLVSYVHQNMNSYWLSNIQQAEKNKETILKSPSQNIDFEIEWTILGLLRQYFTIKELDVVSKLGAGNYGLAHLPSKWHNIIQEAVNIRKGTSVRIFNSDRERLESTIQFTRYLINHCNSFLENSYPSS